MTLHEMAAKWQAEADALNGQGACAEAWGYEACAAELAASLASQRHLIEKLRVRAEALNRKWETLEPGLAADCVHAMREVAEYLEERR